LREAIADGLSEDEVWRLLKQMLHAVAHMSGLNIVHRGRCNHQQELMPDLKPSNILIGTRYLGRTDAQMHKAMSR